ncbi:MAG: hypothetical protein A2504_09965 [Bdellovibrionales bacterium RIFOXYD12_FULL_39_22]|nr:MAG: hypothetical protein A2385_17600 [Bdellovibrionales bacterium RIFOXYB1_FULL_39_21]OFZ43936.1 MAG: hypothetical protein A2485_04270 [Bdellovibrionales bacterium RIFOXYC12_FULL_39_17]OFZ48308.1 MAG: hypothetical protein A2404_01685 [Bdellovibrionales bacterium RIFOXYC1_FULL_39_130]OFZ69524.1 MAG: hypothetical protein A2451_04005 [Bdellovibrionales bacterium RIFOXYC2_FULL_39_8]OFZ94899.1 MAG: hypothetical protein A2504_09965 [Bdellovibrionales bacterium RIFOXYD12_FULL_39_22]HLE12680.1 hyp
MNVEDCDIESGIYIPFRRIEGGALFKKMFDEIVAGVDRHKDDLYCYTGDIDSYRVIDIVQEVYYKFYENSHSLESKELVATLPEFVGALRRYDSRKIDIDLKYEILSAMVCAFIR